MIIHRSERANYFDHYVANWYNHPIGYVQQRHRNDLVDNPYNWGCVFSERQEAEKVIDAVRTWCKVHVKHPVAVGTKGYYIDRRGPIFERKTSEDQTWFSSSSDEAERLKLKLKEYLSRRLVCD